MEEVVRAVLADPTLTSSLVQCAFDADARVRLRAANAMERVSREPEHHLQAYATVLLGLLEEAEQQELRWHLAIVLPRLSLCVSQRRQTAQALQRCMDAKSSIVRTLALQELFDLALQDASYKALALDQLQSAERNGTAAMKAQIKKLLKIISEGEKKP